MPTPRITCPTASEDSASDATPKPEMRVYIPTEWGETVFSTT